MRRPGVLRKAAVTIAALVLGAGTAALAAGGPFALTGTEGTAVSGTVMTIDEGCGGGGQPDCFNPAPVTITWGDGQTGPGTIAGADQGPSGAETVTIAGGHTFTGAGTYTAQSRYELGTGTGVISVADAPLTASAIPAQSLQTAQAFAGEVASFTDPDPAARASLYAVSVNWGDGSAASSGSVSALSAHTFAVSASHTYASAGSFSVVVTIDDSGGAAATATDSFTVAAPQTVTTGPATSAPVAAFSYSPTAVLANVPVTFDASASTGGGLRYHWTFCATAPAPVSTAAVSHRRAPLVGSRAEHPAHVPTTTIGPVTFYCNYTAPPQATGETTSFTFPYAPVHDAGKFSSGVDPTRRQESYSATLTVSNAAGSASVTHYVTVSPDSQLSASAIVGSGQLASDGLTEIGSDGIATLDPTAFDNDAPTGQITEEDWLLGRAGPALICTPGTCSPGTGAFFDPLAPSTAAAEPPYLAAGQIRLSRAGARSVGSRRATARPAHATPSPTAPVLTKCPPSCRPPAFPALQFNFSTQALLEAGLAPLPEINLASVLDPGTGQTPTDPQTLAQDQAAFLREYSYEVQTDTPIEYPDSEPSWPGGFSSEPQHITLTVKDNAGQTATVHVPVQFRGAPGPSAGFSYIPPPAPASKSITQTSDPQFDTSGVGTAGGAPVQYYVLQVGTPQDVSKAVAQQCLAPNGPAVNPSAPLAARASAEAQAAAKKFVPKPQPAAEPGKPSLGEKGGQASTSPEPDLNIPVPTPKTWQQLLDGQKAARVPGSCVPFDPEISEPIFTMVTTDPSQIADPGAIFANAVTNHTYSVMLTVYNALGISKRTRIDGFTVTQAGGCGLPQQSIDDTADNGNELGLSGSQLCTTAPSNKYNHQLFYSSQAIDLNGLTLEPANGGYIGVDVPTDGSAPSLFTSSSPPAAPPSGGGDCLAVTLLIDNSPSGKWGSFCRSTGDQILQGAVLQVPPIAGATYDSQDIAGLSANITDCGASALRVMPELPPVFDFSSGAGTSATGTVELSEQNVPSALNLSSEASGTVTRVHRQRRAARPADCGHIAGAGADILKEAEGSLGDSIPFPDGISFTYDDTTDEWTGTGDISIPGLPASLKATIVFRGSQLISAGGSLDVPIEVYPGVTLTGVQFAIDEDPLTIGAGITVNAVGILDGTGALTVKPDTPWDVRFDGGISLDGAIPLGSAYVELNEDTGLSFGGGFDYDFGPVSLSANLSGAFDPPAWYVQASGSACLGPCIDVDAIASSVGVAGCGSIDLVFTHLGIGAGYLWSTHKVQLLGGSCDLSAYQPNIPGASDATLTAADTALARGQTSALPQLNRRHNTFEVSSGQRAEAFTFTGPAGEIPPLVTLYEPKGPDGGGGRTITSPAQIGDYQFTGGLSKINSPTVYTDENPLNDTTTFIVADPHPGTWTFSLDQGSPPVLTTETAAALPPFGTVQTDLVRPPKSLLPRTLMASPRVLAGIARAGLKVRLPSIEAPRVRELRVTLPKHSGRVAIVEQGAHDGQTLATFNGRTRRQQLVFDPPPAGTGRQRLIAYYLGANGLPRGSRVLRTFMAPPQPRLAAPDILKVIRKADEAVLLLRHGPADPNAGAIVYQVGALAGDGTNEAFPVMTREVRQIDGHPAIIVRGIVSRVGAKFVVWASYEGHTGPSSRFWSRS